VKLFQKWNKYGMELYRSRTCQKKPFVINQEYKTEKQPKEKEEINRRKKG
jgi:hypothetical protein